MRCRAHALPHPAISLSLSLSLSSLLSPLSRPPPFRATATPTSTRSLCTNSKPPPETVASLFAFYPRASTGAEPRVYMRGAGDINFARESNNKCWTFAALQVYRCCRRFTWAFAMKKKINIERIGQWKDGDYSFRFFSPGNGGKMKNSIRRYSKRRPRCG